MKKMSLHKAIVHILDNGGSLASLLGLLRVAEITEGHDEIISALYRNYGSNPTEVDWDEIKRLEDNLLEQKREAANRPADDRKARAMMIAWEKLVARDQRHLIKIDEESYKLFEIVKRLERAKTVEEFQTAVADLDAFS